MFKLSANNRATYNNASIKVPTRGMVDNNRSRGQLKGRGSNL